MGLNNLTVLTSGCSVDDMNWLLFKDNFQSTLFLPAGKFDYSENESASFQVKHKTCDMGTQTQHN